MTSGSRCAASTIPPVVGPTCRRQDTSPLPEKLKGPLKPPGNKRNTSITLLIFAGLMALASLVLIILDPTKIGPWLTLLAMICVGLSQVLILRGRGDT